MYNQAKIKEKAMFAKKIKMLIIIIFIFLISTSLLYPVNALTEPVTAPVFINEKIINEGGFIYNATPYLPISMLSSYFSNPAVTIDINNHKLILDTNKMKIFIGNASTSEFIKNNAGEIYIPLKNFDNIYYFPLNTMSQIFRLRYNIKENSIHIGGKSNQNEKWAIIGKDNTRIDPTLTSSSSTPIYLNKNDNIIVVSETKNLYKIRLMDNREAFVDKVFVEISKINLSDFDIYSAPKTKLATNSKKISLVWQYVDEITPPTPEDKILGIDVLSPTWFDLAVNGGGNIENNGDRGYTDSAHDKGYIVWSTITNNMSAKGSTAYTTTVFNNANLLNKSVAQYLLYASLYNVDGINIDYETVADADAGGLVAFTAALREHTENMGLNLSIDTLIPRPWTIEYDRKELSKYVDFLVVMTYDEHWGSSPIAGSVASYPWVLDSLLKTLQEVPNDKLLLGVPLYMREWHFNNQNKLVNSSALKMEAARNIFLQNNAIPTWLDKEKQFYVEYTKDGILNKVWIEDSRSIAEKLNLINEYNLAGSASWQYSQAEPKVFDVYDGILHKGKDVSEYELPY
jgi:spore germination protein YaaH